MDIQRAMSTYVRDMLASVRGLKALVLDDDTAAIVGLSISQTELNRASVYLSERLVDLVERSRDASGGAATAANGLSSRRQLDALVFLRPSAENTLLLGRELRSPHYAAYYVHFSNAVRRSTLEELAQADAAGMSRVQHVHETFADVCALAPALFSLGVSPCLSISKNGTSIASFERVVEGVVASVLALQRRPVLRYDVSSVLCRNLAERVSVRLDQERPLLESSKAARPATATAAGAPLLLLLDRREDPVTPLLNQWTYEAMVHELLGIHNNIVRLPAAEKSFRGGGRATTTAAADEERREYVLDARADDFYRRAMHLNFGELGDEVKRLVDGFQAERRLHDRLESVDDMLRFVEQYPEFRRQSHGVSKHVTLLGELSQRVNARQLLRVSELEQDLASRESESEHRTRILQLLGERQVSRRDKLRLVMLFALRYESSASQSVSTMLTKLQDAGVEAKDVQLVRALLRYAGMNVRHSDVFSNRNFWAKARTSVRRGFGGVANVYTQHRPLLAPLVEDALGGRLRGAEYPSLHGDDNPAACREMIVFIAGGVTYEEARAVAQLNAGNPGASIVLGGSAVHNMESFLEELAKLSTAAQALL